MKTLIINGSPRKGGETAILITEIIKQLRSEVTVVDTYYSGISPCVDCRFCWTHPNCAINDDMQRVYQLINSADNIIIASPIYFGSITGSLLNWASRLQYFWVSKKFRKDPALKEKHRKGFVLLVDGGDGCMEEAFRMAKRLLKHMGAKYKDFAYFSGTDHTGPTLPKAGDPVMLAIHRMVRMMNGNGD